MIGRVRTVGREVEERPEVLGTLKWSIWLVSLPFGILSFLLPIYGKEIGADAIQIGLFFAVFSLMTVLLRPLIGDGMDRFGRRQFFLAGLLGYVLTMVSFLLSTQIWIIMVARMLQGIASAFLWLSSQAITADVSHQDERGRAFGTVEQAGWQGAMVGTTIGFALIMSLGSAQGWRLLFLGCGAASLVALLLAWRRLPETYTSTPQRSRKPIAWSRPWALLLLVTLVTGASASMIWPVIMVFLQDHLSAEVAMLSLAYLPAALVGAFLPSRLGMIADRFGRKPLMVFGLVVAAASSFLIPNLTSLLGLAVLWAVQMLCYSAGDPAERALVADLTGGHQRGRAYGLYALAAGLGATAGPLVGGWLYETAGPRAPFYANGVVLALCALVLWLLLDVPRQRADLQLD